MKSQPICLILLVGATLAAAPAPAPQAGITATRESPYAKLKRVGMREVRWTRGFWAERFELTYRTTVPAIWDAMNTPGNGSYFPNLRVAAGLDKGEYRGMVYSDGDVYKWIETAAQVFNLTRDTDLDRRMDEAIAIIAKAQAPDGYISTCIQLTDKKRWEQPANHEFYNIGHLLTAAVIHHRATGKTNFLVLARKAADNLFTEFHRPPDWLLNAGYNPSQIMGLVELYRETGDRRYLDLAGVFVDSRGAAPGGTEHNQSRTLLRKETEAVGHAVLGTYLYCGAADIFAETGEKGLWDALERLWRNVTTQKLSIIGGAGGLFHGMTTRRDPTHEAFGANYQLPNRTGKHETCATVANAMWNWRLLSATGEARFADVMEQALYNGMLSAVSLDGRRFFYANPLRRYGAEFPLSNGASVERWPNNAAPGAAGGFCCPANLARTIASVHTLAYSRSPSAVWVNLYGANTLDNDALELIQETDYPWEGKVRFKIDRAPQGEFALMLRVPGWAEGASIRVNRMPGPPATAGTYAEVRRQWAAGDIVELDLPMDARLVEANPLVEENRNQAAVLRGPMVYCLESPDLPAGVHINDVAIPAGVKLMPRHDAKLLKGVTVLEGQAQLVCSGEWSGLLYRTLRPQKNETVNLRLIPYYA